MPLSEEKLVAGTYAIGPAAVLSGALLTIATNAVWFRNVGETSCRWRRTYSPDGRAYGIWYMIYITTMISCIVQFTGQTPVLDWFPNALWALSWTICALWTPFFDGETPMALRAAASLLFVAAGAATLAASTETAWRNRDNRFTMILLTAPLSALTGWLWVAAVLGWGIANAASNPRARAEACYVPPKRTDESEEEYRYRRRVLYREAYARMKPEVSTVPLLVAIAVATLCALIPDPLVAVPVAWAIVNLKAFPSVIYLLALFVLCVGATVAVLQSYR